MRRAVHSTIFIAIAGSYTAVAGIALTGWARTTVLLIVWIGAALGAAGVILNVLDGSQTAACLARALAPAGTPRLPGLAGAAACDTEEPITLDQPARRQPNRAVHRDTKRGSQ